MHNKIHHIIDHANDYPAIDAAHTLRIGLMTNTVNRSRPVVIQDYKKILLEETCIEEAKLLEELPLTLHFNAGDMMVAVLVVYDADNKEIQCFPFSDNNEDKSWFAYDMGFSFIGENRIKLKPVHPWVDLTDDLYQQTIDHMEALSAVVLSFLSRLSSGDITLVEEGGNFDKINKKRTKNGLSPIVDNWVINDKPEVQAPLL